MSYTFYLSYNLISISTPLGNSNLVKTSTVSGVGFTISIKRLWVLISNCSRESLYLWTALRIVYTSFSVGKGYQGVIKRHGQHIGPKGHGSGAHRIVGSMGPIAPNRIAPGKKLPGQMGHVTRTIQNLEVVAVDPENNLLLIKGSVPGPKKGLVVVKTAIKKAGQVNPVHELVDYTPEEVEETVVEEAVEAAAAE